MTRGGGSDRWEKEHQSREGPLESSEGEVIEILMPTGTAESERTRAGLTAWLVPAPLLQTSRAGKEDVHILKRELLRIKFYFLLYLSD